MKRFIYLITILLVFSVHFQEYAQTMESLTLPSVITLRTNAYQSFNAGSGTTTNISYDFKVDEGNYQSSGYLGEGLRPYLKSNPGALKELDEFHSHRVRSLLGYGACLGGTILCVTAGMDDKAGTNYDPYTGTTSNSGKVINTTGIVFLVAAVAGLIYGGWNYFAASSHIYNAVDIYNHGGLSEIDNSKGKYSFNLGFIENKLRMQLSF